MNHPPHFDRAISPCRYDGTVKELIHAFKYGNKPHLGAPLSRLMVRFIEEYDIFIDIIDAVIPMPLHSARMREREFNQAAVLGEHLARRFNKPELPETLIRKRSTRTQTGLQPAQRFSNVQGCFEIRKPEPIAGKNILLVDDVLTTGATASEAALVLKENGARIVLVITAAC
jgi:ComF family protein